MTPPGTVAVPRELALRLSQAVSALWSRQWRAGDDGQAEITKRLEKEVLALLPDS